MKLIVEFFGLPSHLTGVKECQLEPMTQVARCDHGAVTEALRLLAEGKFSSTTMNRRNLSRSAS